MRIAGYGSAFAHDFSRVPVRPLMRMSTADHPLEQRADRHEIGSAASTQMEPVAVPHLVHDVVRSSGRPLDRDTRTRMEQRFGHDLGHVRVHTDAKANESARALDAQAYTVAPHIVFEQPAGLANHDLLAHELTHVLQPEAAGAILRRPKKRQNRAEKEDARVRELAKRPQDAHAAWRNLQTMQRVALATEMAKRYGDDFAQKFLWFTEHPVDIVTYTYGPGFAELTPDYFYQRGYRLWQRSSVNEFWVHPSGMEVQKVLDSDKPPQPLPEPPVAANEGAEELEKYTLDILDTEISDETTEMDRLTEWKGKLEKMQKWTPDYAAEYASYLDALRDMQSRIASDISDIEQLRENLTEMGSSAVSTIDSRLPELEQLQWWAESATSSMGTFGIEPIEMPDPQ